MSRKKTVLTAVCVFVLLLSFGCVTTDLGDLPRVAYLKNNIHYQDYADRGGKTTSKASYANWTNPGAGHDMLTVNTQVDIGVRRGLKGREILITRIEDEKQVHMEYNIRKMGLGMEEYMDLITSPDPNPVNLKRFSATDQKGIKEGKPYKGMTKDGIRAALGYPALHKTPSLEENTWFYWQNRWKEMHIVFDDSGKVIRIRK